ncbi:MAG: ABC transporter ATP-binding protein [Campylobacterota bacterium]|nr:ABC transporter ATP-binding protein [Campylobacterota bacterium]
MDKILEVKNISKHFTDFTSVDGIDFFVEEGGFFSILGPSGCGKTTLLRMISGFEEESEGEILIRGESMKGIPPELRPVNIVFQSLALFPMMNVKENVAFGLKRKKMKKALINAKVSEMLSRVGLTGFESKKVTELSGGQRQRVAIARSLVMEPSILLLDEPLGALDRKLREHMKVELKELQKELGTTFIYITHDQSEALVMSDKIAVMNKGRFEQVDTPRNLYKNPKTAFVASFVGESNKFEIIQKENDMLITKGGWRLKKSELDFIPKVLYIRPEAFILNPLEEKKDMSTFAVTIKSILFDGANTKLSTFAQGSEDEILIALPQNAHFEELSEGDTIHVGVHQDDLKCYEVE